MRDMFSIGENMMDLFGALSVLLLIEGAILVVLLYRLDSVEDVRRKELEKLLAECIDE